MSNGPNEIGGKPQLKNHTVEQLISEPGKGLDIRKLEEGIKRLQEEAAAAPAKSPADSATRSSGFKTLAAAINDMKAADSDRDGFLSTTERNSTASFKELASKLQDSVTLISNTIPPRFEPPVPQASQSTGVSSQSKSPRQH